MKILGIITGLLLIISGVYCFMHPVLTFASLGWLVGLAVIISGAGSLAAWWEGRKSGSSNGWELVSALLTVLVGVIVLCNLFAMFLTDMAIVALFGVWLLVTGILRIVASVRLKFRHWGFGAVWGAVLILVAVYALLHPMVSMMSLGWCVAAVLVTQGINLTYAAAVMKGKKDA